MKPEFKNKNALANYFNFDPLSDNDFERLDKAWEIYCTNYRGDGCMGCAAEVLAATSGSNKTTISNSGRIDCRVLWQAESGKVVPVSAERKTSGGRIQTINTEFSRAETMQGKFIVYSMDVCNKNTSYLRRRVNAKIIPRKLFIQKLQEFKAVKTMRHNGEIDGFGIQSSSKKLFLWLDEYPVEYDRNRVYTAEDFQGLS